MLSSTALDAPHQGMVVVLSKRHEYSCAVGHTPPQLRSSLIRPGPYVPGPHSEQAEAPPSVW